jgi:hypothetical protein
MPNTPSTNPLVQQIQILLSGGGYNFYDTENQARADDLLVRQQASDTLAQASTALQTLETACRQRFLPPATRDNSFPPPEVMESLRALGRLREQIRGLETAIRGMAVPTQDKIWWRFRQEPTLLHNLLTFDLSLLQRTADIAQQAHSLTPDAWHSGDTASLQATLPPLEALVRDRQKLLSLS